MVTFSTDEQALINKQKLPDDRRPSYFSSLSQNFIQISPDFEGYLILQPQDQKQRTLTWIQEASKIQVPNIDHDAILNRYFIIRQTDALTRIDELDSMLNNFAQFQAGLLTDGTDPSRFAAIGEVNILTRSLRRPLDKIAVQRDLGFHEQTLVNLLKGRLDLEQTNTSTQQELQSWQNVISTYRGQSSRSGSLGDVGLSQLVNTAATIF